MPQKCSMRQSRRRHHEWIGRQLDGWTRIVHRDLGPGFDDGRLCTASRPIDEMRGNCDDYALDVRKELATMEGIPGKLTALTSRGAAPPMSPIGQSLLVTLHNTVQVTLAATPKHGGPYAGSSPSPSPQTEAIASVPDLPSGLKSCTASREWSPRSSRCRQAAPRSSRRSSIGLRRMWATGSSCPGLHRRPPFSCHQKRGD